MTKRYFQCTVLVQTDDEIGHYDCGCDETFDVIRSLRAMAPEGLVTYKEICEEEYAKSPRVLTPEGGI